MLPEYQLRRYFLYFMEKSTPQRRLEFLLQQASYVQACTSGAKVDFSDFGFDKKTTQSLDKNQDNVKKWTKENINKNPAFVGFGVKKWLQKALF